MFFCGSESHCLLARQPSNNPDKVHLEHESSILGDSGLHKYITFLPPPLSDWGMTSGTPLDPYAHDGSMVSVAFSPTLMSRTASSHPLITWFEPTCCIASQSVLFAALSSPG